MTVLKRGRIAMSLVLLLTCIGCGGPDYGEPVSVKGTLKLDGKPLGDVTVIFHATGDLPVDVRTQRTSTNTDGVYTLADVYPGEYTVTFERAMSEPEDPGMAPADLTSEDDPLTRYAGEDSLSATVSKEKTEFNFELESES